MSSSRVQLPDDPRVAAPLTWRQIGSPAAPPAVPTGLRREAEGPVQPDPAQVKREWEQRVAEARAAGLREGETAGRNRAAAEQQAVLERFTRTIEEVAGLRARLRREAEADTVKLAIAIARRVLRRELAIDPEALHGLVLAALEKLQAQEICRVRVHPGQVAAIAALLQKAGNGIPIEVVADGSGDPGAAVFETERGNLDASVESQLGEIERGLADALRRNR